MSEKPHPFERVDLEEERLGDDAGFVTDDDFFDADDDDFTYETLDDALAEAGIPGLGGYEE